ncbi:MAG: hypothetical protein M0Z49_16865 [Chloroflexi bacterium]|nr:hypothetical protein [Chloroflexota bacterium]
MTAEPYLQPCVGGNRTSVAIERRIRYEGRGRDALDAGAHRQSLLSDPFFPSAPKGTTGSFAPLAGRR